MTSYRDIFMLLAVLRVRWRHNMCAEAVKKKANVARRISVERCVVIADWFLRVYTLKKESRASPVTEASEVARVSKKQDKQAWRQDSLRKGAKLPRV